jgi:serine/threonine protein kinase
MIGRQVGRFHIVSNLGEGGMGSVWRAEDPMLGRNVALKFLSEGTKTPGARRRFLREARATSKLEHPGVAAVYEAGEDETGRLFWRALQGLAGCSTQSNNSAQLGAPRMSRLPLSQDLRLPLPT